MRGAKTIETHANVIETNFSNPGAHRFVDQRSVAGQGGVETQRFAAAGDIEDVRTQQGFAARQNQCRHLEGFEIIHHPENLPGTQLTRKILVRRNGIAVLTGQIAAADQVPDDDRTGRLAVRADGRRRGYFLHELRNSEHGSIEAHFSRRVL